MQVEERIVSVKRHTLGYVIDGKEYTRNQAVKLVRTGQVKNARVVNSTTYGRHIIGAGESLYNLPSRFGSPRRFAARRRK